MATRETPDKSDGILRDMEHRSQFDTVPLAKMSEADIAGLIQKLRHHEAELEQLRLATEAGQLGLWDRDLLTEQITWSPYLYKLLGRDLDGPAITGETFFEYIHPEDRPRVRRHVEESCASGQIDFCDEFRIVREDGQVRWLASAGRIYRDDEGHPVRMSGVNYDITDRCQAEASLREYERKFRSLTEADIIGIITADMDTVTSANDEFLRMIGFTRAELEAGRIDWKTLTPPEFAPQDEKGLAQLQARGWCEPFEKEYVRKDGSRVPILIGASVISHEPLSWICFVLDLTARKRAEQIAQEARDSLETQVDARTQALRSAVQTLEEEVRERIAAEKLLKQQKETLEVIVDNIPVMLCFYDGAGKVTLINEALRKTLGYSLEDFQNNDVMRLCYPDPAYRKQVWEYMTAAAPNEWRDFLVQSKGHGKIASSWANVRLVDGSYLGIGIDIRQRKRFENRIKSSEERYRTLVELSPDGIGIAREGQIQFVNSTACRLLQAEKSEDLVGKPILDLIHPDYRERTMKQLEFLRRRRKALRGAEAKVVALDGSVLDVELAGMPIAFENKPATQIVMRDITQRKEAEARLRKNALQLQQQAELLDLAHDTILVQDLEGRITFWNRGAERSYGWTKEEAVGRISHELLHTRFPGDVMDITAAFLKEGRWNGELTHTTRAGQTVIVSSRWALQRGQGGTPSGILEIDRDITERKRAEQESLEARRFAESVLGTVQEALVVLDAGLTVISANRSFYGTFEVTPAETEGRPVYEIGNRQWDLPELRRLLEDILPNNTRFEGFEVEHDFERIGHRTMLLNARRIYREAAQTEMILLAIQDITVRKQQEQEILEKQRQVAELTEEVLLTEERERRQIATALHDSIGQCLAFSKRELAALCKDLPAELSEKFDQVKTQIDEAIRETRSLTFDLSPATLYTFGLEAALEELAEQFSQREGFKCHFQAEEGDRPLSEQSKVLLYRATRELLINVAKHAAARNVHVRIKRATQNVQIEVEDDGKGFDLARLEPVQGKQPGFGLFSIRERLAHTKGTFDIRSVPGDGTIITMQAALQTTEGNDSRRASS